MLLIIIAVVVLIASIVLAFVFAPRDENRNKIRALFIGAGAVVAAVVVLCGCFKTIPAGHTGVVTTLGRVENYVMKAGPHFKAPYQKVIKMDNRVQKLTIDLLCFTSDLQEVSVKYTLNYQIDESNAMNIYSRVGTNYCEAVITPAVTESAKISIGQNTSQTLIAERSELALKIKSDIETRLAEYNIKLCDASIEDIDFTDIFTEAVEKKQVAEQNKLQAQIDADKALIEANNAADIRKLNADAEAYELRVKAEAEAEANALIASSITNTLIDYEYIEKWNGKLPEFVSDGSGSVMPILDFND